MTAAVALVLFALTALLPGCGARDHAPLSHEAYVWQRSWSAAVVDAVRAAPASIAGLRVLALEIEPGGRAPARPGVDPAALAASGRPITAVVRIDGSRLPGEVTLAPVMEAIAGWQAAGVNVVGVEVDHDCATAALPAYAAWLRRERARLPARLRVSITALPSWTGAASLPALAASVDELVLQLHAVRAPELFDGAEARRWVERFAAEVGRPPSERLAESRIPERSGEPPWRPVRVALPTYRVTAFGRELAADPTILSAFARQLAKRPIPGVVGVVWFRLPVAGDRRAWSGPTLAAVIAGRPLESRVRVRLGPSTGGARDVLVENTGTLDGPAPGRIRLSGRVEAADGASGYAEQDGQLVAPAAPRVPAGTSLVVGWVRGDEVTIDAL